MDHFIFIKFWQNFYCDPLTKNGIGYIYSCLKNTNFDYWEAYYILNNRTQLKKVQLIFTEFSPWSVMYHLNINKGRATTLTKRWIFESLDCCFIDTNIHISFFILFNQISFCRIEKWKAWTDILKARKMSDKGDIIKGQKGFMSALGYCVTARSLQSTCCLTVSFNSTLDNSL